MFWEIVVAILVALSVLRLLGRYVAWSTAEARAQTQQRSSDAQGAIAAGVIDTFGSPQYRDALIRGKGHLNASDKQALRNQALYVAREEAHFHHTTLNMLSPREIEYALECEVENYKARWVTSEEISDAFRRRMFGGDDPSEA